VFVTRPARWRVRSGARRVADPGSARRERHAGQGSERRKERESNPQGPCEPTRFRNGIPRPWQSFRGDFGRRRTCNLPIKSRVLCRVELRSQRCGRQGSNLRRPAFQAGALPAELRPHGWSGQGWSRTSDLLFVRQALVPTELLALDGSGTRNRTSTSRFRVWRPAG
jgi:hypothetical protein